VDESYSERACCAWRPKSAPSAPGSARIEEGLVTKPAAGIALILQQVITDVYVMKVERQGNRLVNAIVDRIPNTSQEESWKWWNK
jgi:hypothetical protein